MDPMSAGVPWFPQEWAPAFYILKGGLSLVATALLLFHMRKVKAQEALTLGRWLRYLVLLYLAVLMTGASVEQVSDESLVSYRNLGSLVGAVVLIIATVVSIHESRDRIQA